MNGESEKSALSVFCSACGQAAHIYYPMFKIGKGVKRFCQRCLPPAGDSTEQFEREARQQRRAQAAAASALRRERARG